jgi:hypothetical protein
MVSLFQHFSNLGHKVSSSRLHVLTFFFSLRILFCRLAQAITAFKTIVKVTNNHVWLNYGI